ncbi:hypothetical protein [Patiriisocius marinus]|uniref:hypothetical protein n=1 Tax=Patiriisocius marinus TaxID=1397112 RepID=UPI00232FB3BD|nr:hypothetical protein [Patiriisocius marinus]
MKTSIVLLFFVSLSLVSQTAFTQENFRKTDIVTTVFKALKKQNEKKVLKTLPTKDDINFLIPLARGANTEENIPEVDTIIANFKKAAIENFKKVIKKGNTFGIQWDAIVLENVRYEANPDPNIALERGNIILVCSSKNKKFLITLRKTYKIRDYWRLMNTIKFTLL